MSVPLSELVEDMDFLSPDRALDFLEPTPEPKVAEEQKILVPWPDHWGATLVTTWEDQIHWSRPGRLIPLSSEPLDAYKIIIDPAYTWTTTSNVSTSINSWWSNVT